MAAKTIDQLDYTLESGPDLLNLHWLIQGVPGDGNGDKLYKVIMGHLGGFIANQAVNARQWTKHSIADAGSIARADQAYGLSHYYLYEGAAGSINLFGDEGFGQDGYVVRIVNVGSGELTITCSSGTVFARTDYETKIPVGGMATAIMFVPGVWVLTGDLVPSP